MDGWIEIQIKKDGWMDRNIDKKDGCTVCMDKWNECQTNKWMDRRIDKKDEWMDSQKYR